MGSSISVKSDQRVCPNGYDQEKFKMILGLYDKLDNNGDNIVDVNELKNIAELHIKNKITKNNNALQENEKDKKNNLELLETELANKKERILKELQNEYDNKHREIIIQYEKNKNNLEEKNKMYQTMNYSTKSETFLSVISDDHHIDFWEFFKYMKTRTSDIKNIKFP